MGWLLHCNTGYLKRYKPSVRFRIAINCVIEIACSKDIMGHTNLAYSEKANLQVPIRLSFLGLPMFLGKEKSAKSTDFATGCCFIQSLIISLQHLKLCISLLNQSLGTLGIT